MFDINVPVPNITSSKYSMDNRFLLLKNYLQELNDTLSVVLSAKTMSTERIFREELEKSEKNNHEKQVQLQSQSVEKFNKLKEQIIRTANEIESSYKSEIEKNEKSILALVEKNYFTKGEQGEYEANVNSSFEQIAEQISLVNESVESVTTDLENFKDSSRSEIAIQSSSIMSQVEKNFQSKTQAEETEGRIYSQITQTENTINENFTRELSHVSEDVSTVGGKVNELISDLDVYIRRGELEDDVYGIEIGRSDSNIKARFTNDRLSFYQGVSEVAYISGSSLFITNADILDYLRIGNSTNGYFLFDTTANGLEVRWIDAN